MFPKLFVRKFSTFKNIHLSIKQCFSTYSFDLEKTVLKKKWFLKIPEANKFEEQMVEFFKENSSRKYGKANLKQSFVYMLIDPRLSQNLPKKCQLLSQHEIWKRFCSSIFYVGKGKNARPHDHLHEALSTHSLQETGNLQESTSVVKSKKFPSKKVEKILDIWNSGNGVVCLTVFHNILEAEAYTREAAIIEALSLRHLTNQKGGKYYGPVRMWPITCRRKLGVFIVFKALRVYLAEGESELSPEDI